MFESALFNNYNEFQCRISNFDDILCTSRLIKMGLSFFLHPRKSHAQNSRSDSTPRKLTLTRPVTVKVNKITSHVFHLFFSQLLYVVLYTRTLDYIRFLCCHFRSRLALGIDIGHVMRAFFKNIANKWPIWVHMLSLSSVFLKVS